MKTEKVHISKITVGDTVMHNGQMRTVCRRTFNCNDFVGQMMWGDSYNMGKILVERIIFDRFYCGKKVN